MSRVNRRRPSRDDFRSDDGGAWGGLAAFSGVLAVMVIARSRVASLLPAPLSIGKSDTPEHPLLLVAGEMSDGGAHVAGVELHAGTRYREAAIFVPFVEHPRTGEATVFPLRMYGDDLRAVFLGNACYGLRKETASIAWDGDEFVVRCADGPRFRCSGAIDGRWSRSTHEKNEELEWLRRMSELPVIGRRENGQLVEFDFVWDFQGADSCAFDGCSEVWLGEGDRDSNVAASSRGFAIRRMGWRTTPPRSV